MDHERAVEVASPARSGRGTRPPGRRGRSARSRSRSRPRRCPRRRRPVAGPAPRASGHSSARREASWGWRPTVARTSGWRPANSTARRDDARSVPTHTSAPDPGLPGLLHLGVGIGLRPLPPQVAVAVDPGHPLLCPGSGPARCSPGARLAPLRHGWSCRPSAGTAGRPSPAASPRAGRPTPRPRGAAGPRGCRRARAGARAHRPRAGSTATRGARRSAAPPGSRPAPRPPRRCRPPC